MLAKDIWVVIAHYSDGSGGGGPEVLAAFEDEVSAAKLSAIIGKSNPAKNIMVAYTQIWPEIKAVVDDG